jgi:hypothetical protein
MIEHEFKGVFLTQEGGDREDQGLDVKGDQWHEIKPVTIDLETIESYYQSVTPVHGQMVCRVRTKSGDDWTLAITYQELRNLKKSLYGVRTN